MHFQEYNSSAKQTVVFLHGASASGQMWEANLPYLTGFHCLAIDLPGHGSSRDLGWESFTQVAKEVADLIRLHAHDGIAHVVGLSLGAYISLYLLRNSPEVVQRTVISGVHLGQIPLGWLVVGSGYLLQPFMRRRFFLKLNAKGMKIPASMVDAYIDQAKLMSSQAFHAINKEVVNVSLSIEELPHDKHILALAGEQENRLILSSLSLFQALPNAEAYLVKDAAHVWNVVHPELFSETVSAWISQKPLDQTKLLQV